VPTPLSIYDALHHLTGADHPLVSGLLDETFTYDANGNRTTKTEKLTNAVTTYTYDVENQLTHLDLPNGTVAAYRYDGLGRRIEKAVNGTIQRFLYDQEDLLLVFSNTTCLTQAVLHGPGLDAP